MDETDIWMESGKMGARSYLPQLKTSYIRYYDRAMYRLETSRAGANRSPKVHESTKGGASHPDRRDESGS